MCPALARPGPEPVAVGAVMTSGKRNVVDGETKYIPFDTWALHMGYKLGRPNFTELLKGRGD